MPLQVILADESNATRGAHEFPVRCCVLLEDLFADTLGGTLGATECFAAVVQVDRVLVPAHVRVEGRLAELALDDARLKGRWIRWMGAD